MYTMAKRKSVVKAIKDDYKVRGLNMNDCRIYTHMCCAPKKYPWFLSPADKVKKMGANIKSFYFASTPFSNAKCKCSLFLCSRYSHGN